MTEPRCGGAAAVQSEINLMSRTSKLRLLSQLLADGSVVAWGALEMASWMGFSSWVGEESGDGHPALHWCGLPTGCYAAQHVECCRTHRVMVLKQGGRNVDPAYDAMPFEEGAVLDRQRFGAASWTAIDHIRWPRYTLFGA